MLLRFTCPGGFRFVCIIHGQELLLRDTEALGIQTKILYSPNLSLLPSWIVFVVWSQVRRLRRRWLFESSKSEPVELPRQGRRTCLSSSWCAAWWCAKHEPYCTPVILENSPYPLYPGGALPSFGAFSAPNQPSTGSHFSSPRKQRSSAPLERPLHTSCSPRDNRSIVATEARGDALRQLQKRTLSRPSGSRALSPTARPPDAPALPPCHMFPRSRDSRGTWHARERPDSRRGRQGSRLFRPTQRHRPSPASERPRPLGKRRVHTVLRARHTRYLWPSERRSGDPPRQPSGRSGRSIRIHFAGHTLPNPVFLASPQHRRWRLSRTSRSQS